MVYYTRDISKRCFYCNKLFKEIYKIVPRAKILLGEIVEPEKKILENNLMNTIMPEYIFSSNCLVKEYLPTKN